MKLREFAKQTEKLTDSHKKAEENSRRLKKVQRDAQEKLRECNREFLSADENADDKEKQKLHSAVLSAKALVDSATKKVNEAEKQLNSLDKEVRETITELKNYELKETSNLAAVKQIKKIRGEKNVKDFIKDICDRIELSEDIRKQLEEILGENSGNTKIHVSYGGVTGDFSGASQGLFRDISYSTDDDLVEYWTAQLDSLGERLYSFYSEKYSDYIEQWRLEIPLSETLTFQTADDFFESGMNSNVLGYNDGEHSYVRVGTGNELQTAVHENLHQLSQLGIMIYDGGWRNTQLNEAITELLSERTLGDDFGEDYSAYADNKEAMKLIESVMGEEIIARAYFCNEPELMKNAFDKVMGSGAWENLSDAFDESLEYGSEYREQAIEQRDRMVREYVMKANNQKKAGLSWKEIL